MDIKVLSAQFRYSCPNLNQMQEHRPEVAFFGRSNAGKSSLINSLCNKKDLARTSKTPGRTRHAVVYDVVFSSLDRPVPCHFVDLPGFGFASMSKEEAKLSEELIFSYIEQRQHIDLLCLLIDIRREPDQREQRILSLAAERGIKTLLILTKCDKIPLSKRLPARNNIVKKLGLFAESVILYSNTEEIFKFELQKIISNSLYYMGD